MRCFYSVEHSNTPLIQVQLEETRCGSDHLLSKGRFSDVLKPKRRRKLTLFNVLAGKFLCQLN